MRTSCRLRRLLGMLAATLLLAEILLVPSGCPCRAAEGPPASGSGASADQADSRILWAARTGHELPHFSQGLDDVALSPDGRRLVTCGDTAVLWDVASGQMLRVLPPLTDKPIRHAAFLPDGRRVLTCASGQLAVWDAESGQPLRTMSVPEVLMAMQTSHDGTAVAVVYHADGVSRVRRYDSQTWLATSEFEVGQGDAPPSRVRNLALNGDGSLVLTVTFGGQAGLWDSRTGQPIRRWETGQRLVVHAGMSGDGELAMTGTFRAGAIVWNPRTGQRLREIQFADPGRTPAMCLDSQGKWLLVGHTAGNRASLWEVASGRRRHEFSGHAGGVSAVAFSHDGTRVLTGSQDRSAALWDPLDDVPRQRFHGLTRPTKQVALSGSGRQLLVQSEGGLLVCWDFSAGTVRRLADDTSDSVLPAVSHDGSTAVALSNAHQALVWDARTGDLRCRLDWDEADGTSLLVDHEGTRVVTGHADGRIRFWDSRSGAPRGEFTGAEVHGAAVRALAITSDGTQLFSGHDGGLALQWKTSTRQIVVRFPHERVVHSIAVSHDGQRLLTAGSRLATLHDLRRGRELYRIGITHSFGERAFLSGDGQRLLLHSAWNRAHLRTATGQELSRFEYRSTDSKAFDGRLLFQTAAHHVSILDAERSQERVRLLSLNQGRDWLVSTPDGRYDGSPGGRERVDFCLLPRHALQTDPPLDPHPALAAVRATRHVPGLLQQTLTP